ncbi:DUF418 domain-containing protein [Pseudalkalibacillus berkeleyi]|uniref:DUF418 domain-containing protein n=1 Tax=Pseudalkalibacillus berkeleyi TaxID=1069813 RepID=A0ABS9H4Z3_9BACL|nr:DUF418 domain-containing protein [Pseudalkalibacillus berkeleyi]MCF6139035.1 DUF418 domain-containing protein [Pseudalkalibacillus berkeleyi]
MQPTPLPMNQRIATIDILRGIALFGIFLVNMPTFFMPDFKKSYYSLSIQYEGFDQWVRLFFDLFVQARFYPIFSFLFGFGFYIFLSKAELKSSQPRKLFSRRLFILLGFGILHLIFLWYGDILHTYALTGFLLLLFYYRKAKTIFIWAISLIVLYYTMTASQLLIPQSYMESLRYTNETVGTKKVADTIQMYTGANYGELIGYRFTNEVMPIIQLYLFSAPLILALFLLGLYVAKKGFISDVASHLKLVGRIWVMSGLLAVPLLIWLAIVQLNGVDYGFHQDTVHYLIQQISGLFLATFYIFSVVLFLHKAPLTKFFSALGAAGRMALTNYLLQTVFAVTLALGFDLYNKVGLTVGMLISIAFFSLQLVFSMYWLKHYRFGPAEWLWRTLTYKEKQPFKKNQMELSK